MHPVLFTLGPLPVPTFGVFFLIAYVLGFFFVFRTARDDILMLRANINEETIFDIVTLSSFFGLLGARISYILLHFQDFRFDFFRWILFTYFPGLHLLGAIFGVTTFFFFFAKTRKYPFFLLLDYATFGFLVAAPFAYIGNFFSEKISVYPLQLISALLMGILLAIFLIMKRQRIMQKDGVIALTFLIVFAIVTCGFEFLRLDKTYILFLTYRQWLGMLLLFISLGTLLRMYKKDIILFLGKHNLAW